MPSDRQTPQSACPNIPIPDTRDAFPSPLRRNKSANVNSDCNFQFAYAAVRATSFRQSLKCCSVFSVDLGQGSLKLILRNLVPDRANVNLTVLRGHFELGVCIEFKQLEDRWIEYKRQFIANFGESRDHRSSIKASHCSTVMRRYFNHLFTLSALFLISAIGS